jgi:hypothetical protein
MANTVYTQTVELNENNNIYPAINTFTILSQERKSCNKYIYYPKSGAEFLQ